jgi:cAMP phosphodiesterase
MKIQLLSGGGSNNPREQYLTSFLVDDSVAIDAGSLPLSLNRDRQLAVRHVFITHSHLDHLAGLPLMLDNIFTDINQVIWVYAIEETVDALQKHIFNNVIWPDFTSFKNSNDVNLQFKTILPNEVLRIDDLEIVAIPVNHTVPSVGLILKKEDAAVVISGDTSNTDALWQAAKETDALKAAFIECSYPNRLTDLAYRYGHLSPELLLKEYRKLEKSIPCLAYHVKPAYFDEVTKQLANLQDEKIFLAEPNITYEF